MSIQVKFFASLREQIGISDTEIATADTALDAWNICTDYREPPANLLVAINLDYATLESPVSDGDEVAFFPPVTGG
jgi:molybdopterin synthase sulfur carrier subunit